MLSNFNKLTVFANNIQNLIHILQSERFKGKIIVNPGKFQAIILDKKKSYTRNTKNGQ